MWIARFEAIGDRNAWRDKEKLDNLLPKLEEAAAKFVFVQLLCHLRYNYGELVGELLSGFRAVETIPLFAAELSGRSRRRGETGEEYATELGMLCGVAQGFREGHIGNGGLVQRYLNGLRDEEAQLEMEFHKEPETIDEAMFKTANFVHTRGMQGEKRDRRAVRRAFEEAVESEGETELMSRLTGGMTGIQKKNGTMRDERDDERDGVLQQMLEKWKELTAAKRTTTQSSLPRLSQNSSIGCYGRREIGHVSRACPDRQSSDRRMSRSGERVGYGEDTIRENDLSYQGLDPSVKARTNQQLQ